MTPSLRLVATLALGLVVSIVGPDHPGTCTHASTRVGPVGNDLVGRRVRIQAPALGPEWHVGVFNGTRSEPPCFLVLLFKPRASPVAAIEVAATIPLAGVARLAVFTGAPVAMAAWAGLTSRDTSEGDWRELDLSTIRTADGGTRCLSQRPSP